MNLPSTDHRLSITSGTQIITVTGWGLRSRPARALRTGRWGPVSDQRPRIGTARINYITFPPLFDEKNLIGEKRFASDLKNCTVEFSERGMDGKQGLWASTCFSLKRKKDTLFEILMD